MRQTTPQLVLLSVAAVFASPAALLALRLLSPFLLPAALFAAVCITRSALCKHLRTVSLNSPCLCRRLLSCSCPRKRSMLLKQHLQDLVGVSRSMPVQFIELLVLTSISACCTAHVACLYGTGCAVGFVHSLQVHHMGVLISYHTLDPGSPYATDSQHVLRSHIGWLGPACC